MLFSDRIPDKLQEYPTVMSFMRVLDALQSFKNEIIANSLRVNNAAVLMDKKWLLKKLGDFGVSDIPLDYPIQIIRQYLLNADTVFRTRGSKIGIELYCSLLSFGEVTIDDSRFYQDPKALLLDSRVTGYITGNNSDAVFYVVDDSDTIDIKSSLGITISSKYFNGDYPKEAEVIKKYIQNTIKKNIGYSNSDVTFEWQPRSEFYYHKLLNPYFV